MSMSDKANPRRAAKNKKIVRESEWLRVYELRPGVFEEQSKFLDGLAVTAEDLARRWVGFSQQEKLDLCTAYQAKAALSEEDEKVLNLIIEHGNPSVWGSIVTVLTRHSDRQRVSQFVQARIERQPPPLANFYLAAEILGDRSSIPLLQKKLQQFIQSDIVGTVTQIDYLACCRALWKLTNSAEFKNLIVDHGTTADEIGREAAKRMLG